MSIQRKELDKYLSQYLNIHAYQDYGPNGLQIEGSEEIRKIAFAVSATKESIEQAVKIKANALIVHHGLFWKFHGPKTITKAFAKRVKPLIQNDINLFGFHLPLDAHPELGNAKVLADKLGLEKLKPFGDYKGMPTGMKGIFKSPMTVKKLEYLIQQTVDHPVMTSTEDSDKKVTSLAIITGGANSDWTRCLRENIDSYLTGEMSEHDWHEAKESGVTMFAAGHHATEKLGIQALMKHLDSLYQIESEFIDSSNPA